jgi:pyridoxal phosphate enzyme (YggS family)
MHDIVNNLILINKELSAINSDTKIIAVSKTFPINHIQPAIDHGHIHFGENKVQEALEKWTETKEKNKSIKLHLIGKLQTNKVKFCLPLFDFIHSLDNIKLADKIANEQIKKNFKPKLFIQVNIGEEDQKNGVSLREFEVFYKKIEDFELDIIGLMCIPPFLADTQVYFEKMNNIRAKTTLTELSMGMSNDYLLAAKNSATYVRIGSKIFGQRS